MRFEVARRIVERAADYGIPREDVIVDPLVMPIGAMATAGQQVFRLVRRLREELGVNTTCGASNVSFGMPDRERINAAFLPMAIASGLTSAITNPLAAEVKAAIMAADVLMGNDQDASRWIRAHRDAASSGCRDGSGRVRAVRSRRRAAAHQPASAGRRVRDARRGSRGPRRREGRHRGMNADEASAQVIFTPSGRRGRFEPGTTILDAARSLGVDLDSVCGGRGLCGRCQVVPAEGSYPEARDRIQRRPSLAPRRGRGRVRPASRTRRRPAPRLSRDDSR